MKSSWLATMVPAVDITVPTTPPKRSLIPGFIGLLFTEMPMTWSPDVTLVNVKAKFRNVMKYRKMLFKFVRSLTYGASILWDHSRLHEGTSIYSWPSIICQNGLKQKRSPPMTYDNRDLTSSLIPLSRRSFDVLLGMDRLSKRKFGIVCHEKVVRIPLEGDEVLRVHGERTQGVVKTLMNTKVGESKLSDISVVRDFIDVFPEDLSMTTAMTSKENVMINALTRKERVKPRCVRAMAMTIQYGVRGMILAPQSEAFKQENVRAERLHRSHVLWAEIRESSLTGLELVQETTDKVVLIKEKLKSARNHQKSYVDYRRKPLEFEVGDKVILRVSPWKGVMRFAKKDLKKCLADANLHVPLNEIKVNKTLCFVEEPVEIMDREIRKLKRTKLLSLLVKSQDEISSRRGYYDNRDLTRFVLVFVEAAKQSVTHRLSAAYHPQTGGQVEVSNRGLKRILERTIGEHRASWSDKLDDALIAPDYEASRAHGFVLRSLELQSLA
ncbi:putative reverse transcriptase domain-containing protein [Tanacetum coccineum]